MSELSIVQRRFVELNDAGAEFSVKGYSLIHAGEVFPVAMAKHIGVKPKFVDDREALEKAWRGKQ